MASNFKRKPYESACSEPTASNLPPQSVFQIRQQTEGSPDDLSCIQAYRPLLSRRVLLLVLVYHKESEKIQEHQAFKN